MPRLLDTLMVWCLLPSVRHGFSVAGRDGAEIAEGPYALLGFYGEAGSRCDLNLQVYRILIAIVNIGMYEIGSTLDRSRCTSKRLGSMSKQWR